MCSCSQSNAPGSTVPLRVAITAPSSGVKPMLVSTLRPSRTAHAETPDPMCAITTCSCSAGRCRATPRFDGSPMRTTGREIRSDARPSRASARAPHTWWRSSGMPAWNAVSTTHDLRPVDGSRVRRRASASAGGTCSGASSTAASSCSTDVVVDEDGVPDGGAAMHEAVGDGVNVPRARSEVAQALLTGSASPSISCASSTRSSSSTTLSFRLLEPAFTARMRIDQAVAAAGDRSRSPGPAPVADLWHVLEVLANVVVMAAQLVSTEPDQILGPGRGAPDRRSASITRW